MTSAIPLLSVKGYEELQGLCNHNPRLFYENPSPSALKGALEEQRRKKGFPPEALWDAEIIPQENLEKLNAAERQDDSTDAENAPLLRKSFPDITPVTAADYRLWASINCFALLPYTTRRWNHTNSNKAPCRTSDGQKIKEWIQEHYLGHGTGMKRYNAAARLWWLTELSRRASEYSTHSAPRLLSAMANDVEMYHQLLDRPYLVSNPRIVAKIYDLALQPGNDYMFRRPYPNRMLQSLNLKAAATSLGTLSDETLARVVEEAKPPKGPQDIG